jgi:sulfur-carrier protein adenylyltransferase/sulfurtransferase
MVTGTDDPRLEGPSKTTPLPDLGKKEIARYSRHLIMPEVGMNGQRQLKAASVSLIGASGLSSPLGLYLAAAGIGRLGLVDFDVNEGTCAGERV